MNVEIIGLLFRPERGVTPSASRAALLPRTALGFVFVCSGALKFLFENQGVLRFAHLGMPGEVAYVIGGLEIVCGLFLLVGAFARLSALVLALDMVVAIATTKVPLLFGAGPEPVGAAPKIGPLAFAYQARLDIAMLLVCAYIVAVGAGALSVDAWRARRGAVDRERRPALQGLKHA